MRLCEECLAGAHITFQGLRGHLHRIERAGINMMGDALRKGEHLSPQELIVRLRDV